jgi:hypothetical protein
MNNLILTIRATIQVWLAMPGITTQTPLELFKALGDTNSEESKLFDEMVKDALSNDSDEEKE